MLPLKVKYFNEAAAVDVVVGRMLEFDMGDSFIELIAGPVPRGHSAVYGPAFDLLDGKDVSDISPITWMVPKVGRTHKPRERFKEAWDSQAQAAYTLAKARADKVPMRHVDKRMLRGASTVRAALGPSRASNTWFPSEEGEGPYRNLARLMLMASAAYGIRPIVNSKGLELEAEDLHLRIGDRLSTFYSGDLDGSRVWALSNCKFPIPGDHGHDKGTFALRDLGVDDPTLHIAYKCLRMYGPKKPYTLVVDRLKEAREKFRPRYRAAAKASEADEKDLPASADILAELLTVFDKPKAAASEIRAIVVSKYRVMRSAEFDRLICSSGPSSRVERAMRPETKARWMRVMSEFI